jgi:hypothetical protein
VCPYTEGEDYPLTPASLNKILYGVKENVKNLILSVLNGEGGERYLRQAVQASEIGHISSGLKRDLFRLFVISPLVP